MPYIKVLKYLNIVWENFKGDAWIINTYIN